MPEFNNRRDFSVSQNFLTGRRVNEAIMRRAGFGGGDRVVEIGAGKGHGTQVIAARCARVTAVEIDRALIPFLEKRLAPYPNAEIVCADFLKTALPSGPYKVYSNLPFSVTTQCLLKLVFAENPPGEAWLIAERGAALRWLGMPENPRSLLLKTVFSGAVEMKIDRYEFHPAPSCDTVLFSLKRKKDILPAGERLLFETFISSAYKNLRRGRKPLDGLLSEKQVSRALRSGGLPPSFTHGEELYVQWLCLFRCWQNFGADKRFEALPSTLPRRDAPADPAA